MDCGAMGRAPAARRAVALYRADEQQCVHDARLYRRCQELA